MAATAIGDCLRTAGLELADGVPVLLCVAERSRAGRPRHFDFLLHDIAEHLGATFHPDFCLIEEGVVAGAVSLLSARQLINSHRHRQVIVAGVDSFLVGQTLNALERTGRLLTRANSNGFVPGEAAGAVVLTAWLDGAPPPLQLHGLGFAREAAAFGSGRPLLANGLVQAIQAALAEAGLALHDCDYRIANVNGEQDRFKEAPWF